MDTFHDFARFMVPRACHFVHAGWIHSSILLVLAVVTVLIRVIQGRRIVS